MKTKEEIIDECEGGDISEYPHYALDDFQRTVAKEAMDIWAKQQAIAFAEWMCAEGWESYDGTDRWICVSQGRRVVDIEELYQMFIESQNK